MGYPKKQSRCWRHVGFPDLRAQFIHRIVDVTVQEYSGANLSADCFERTIVNGGRHLDKETHFPQSPEQCHYKLTMTQCMITFIFISTDVINTMCLSVM